MRGILQTYGPAIVSGVALSFCFPRFHLFFLAWVALVPLLWRARSLPPIHASLHFFVAGFVFHALLLQWMLANIMWAGGWAVLGQQLLCVVLALFWAITGLLWRWLGERNAVLGGPIGFALLWVAMEHAQSTIFTGFGWSSLSYSQGADPYVLQLAAIGSGLFISLLIAFVNAAVVELVGTSPRRALHGLTAFIVVAAAHGAGYLLFKPAATDATPLKVGLFQSNYSLEMKWDPEYRYETVRNAAQKSVALATRQDIDLMVWPEALVLADVNDPNIRDLLENTVRQGKFTLLAGAGRTDAGGSYNSVFVMPETGDITMWYDKVHLAPFGEYVPFAKYFPFISKLVPSIGDIDAGDKQKVLPIDGKQVGPLICFEVLFAPMANHLRREGADVLVVATNLAWFGASTAIPQELEIARMRAVETRLPLIHSANTGIGGVFDPYGRFTPVNLWAASGDRLQPLQENLPTDALMMMRLAGAFEVAAKAPQPLLAIQRYFPYAVYCLAASLLAVALLMPSGAARAGSSRRD